MVAPAGPMYQAGTLSGNPLAMTAGIKVGEPSQPPTWPAEVLQPRGRAAVRHAAGETMPHTSRGEQQQW
jgi:glutamate-1-semialdehyde aminotransferase